MAFASHQRSSSQPPSSSHSSSQMSRLPRLSWRRFVPSRRRAIIITSIGAAALFLPLYAQGTIPMARFNAALQPYSPALPHTYDQLKRGLYTGVRGATLELGPGTSSECRFITSTYTLDYNIIESNPFVMSELSRSFAQCGIPWSTVNVRCNDVMTALQSAPSSHYDHIVMSNFLCALKPNFDAINAGDNKTTDGDQVINQCVRVLKPGGRIIFVEQTANAISSSPLHMLSRHVRSLWTRLAHDNVDVTNTFVNKLITHPAIHTEYIVQWNDNGTVRPLSLLSATETITDDANTMVLSGMEGSAGVVAGILRKQRTAADLGIDPHDPVAAMTRFGTFSRLSA